MLSVVRSRSRGRKPHLVWTLLAPSMPIYTTPLRNSRFILPLTLKILRSAPPDVSSRAGHVRAARRDQPRRATSAPPSSLSSTAPGPPGLDRTRGAQSVAAARVSPPPLRSAAARVFLRRRLRASSPAPTLAASLPPSPDLHHRGRKRTDPVRIRTSGASSAPPRRQAAAAASSLTSGAAALASWEPIGIEGDERLRLLPAWAEAPRPSIAGPASRSQRQASSPVAGAKAQRRLGLPGQLHPAQRAAPASACFPSSRAEARGERAPSAPFFSFCCWACPDSARFMFFFCGAILPIYPGIASFAE